MILLERYLKSKPFYPNYKHFTVHNLLEFARALRNTCLYLDVRKPIFQFLTYLIIEEYEVTYRENVYDGCWVNMSSFDNSKTSDWTQIYKNVKEISFAYAGIDPLEHIYYAGLLPKLEYFDLLGNTTRKTTFVNPNNDNTTYYLDSSIIWNFDLNHCALPFERNKLIRDMENLFKTPAFKIFDDIIKNRPSFENCGCRLGTDLRVPQNTSLVVVFDGKHAIPSPEYEFAVDGTNKRCLVLKNCTMFYPYKGNVYWCRESEGTLIIVPIGVVRDFCSSGKIIRLCDPNFDFTI